MTFRSTTPVIYPLQMPQISNPTALQKGIYLFEKPSLEVFKLDIVFNNAGFAKETITQSMSLTAHMLLSGTQDLSNYEISNQLDLLGAYTQIQSDYCKSVLTVYGVQSHFKEIINIIYHALNTPVFPDSELQIKTKQRLKNLRVQQKKTGYRASKLANKLWFGDQHVLGKQVLEQDYENINSDVLNDVFKLYFNHMSFVLTGGTKVIQQANHIANVFINNPIVPLGYKIPQILPSVEKHTENFIIPGSNQASIVMRFNAVDRNHQDYPGLLMTNLIFGGYFGSRLMKNIREDKGWTYGIHSVLKSLPGLGYVDVVADIKGDKVFDVKQEILKEVQSMQDEPVSDAAWNTARQYYLGSIQRAFDQFFHNSDTFITLKENELDLSWYSNLYEALLKLSPEDVQRIAHTYLNPHSLVFTWSGPNIGD